MIDPQEIFKYPLEEAKDAVISEGITPSNCDPYYSILVHLALDDRLEYGKLIVLSDEFENLFYQPIVDPEEPYRPQIDFLNDVGWLRFENFDGDLTNVLNNRRILTECEHLYISKTNFSELPNFGEIYKQDIILGISLEDCDIDVINLNELPSKLFDFEYISDKIPVFSGDFGITLQTILISPCDINDTIKRIQNCVDLLQLHLISISEEVVNLNELHSIDSLVLEGHSNNESTLQGMVPDSTKSLTLENFDCSDLMDHFSPNSNIKSIHLRSCIGFSGEDVKWIGNLKRVSIDNVVYKNTNLLL